jgi:enoyl-CoA hydratase/carnithine racemase
MAENQSILFELEDHTALITLNRPERGNALGAEVAQGLVDAWERVKSDKNIRVAIVTGAGERHFCTGADVGGLGSIGDSAKDAGSKPPYSHREQVPYSPLGAEVWKPVIAAVNGVCAGGGFHFIVDSDIILCSDNATFLDPHVSVGQVAALEPIGLSRRIPLEAVLRMNLVGRWERMNAERALQIGLVGEVVPPERLLSRAKEIAAMIAKNSPAAVRATKRAIWNSLDHGLHEGLAQGWDILTEHWDHPDQKEGPAAFGEKRDPGWQD